MEDVYKTSNTGMSRSTRLKVRNGDLIKNPSLQGINVVKIVLDGEEDQLIDIEKTNLW